MFPAPAKIEARTSKTECARPFFRSFFRTNHLRGEDAFRKVDGVTQIRRKESNPLNRALIRYHVHKKFATAGRLRHRQPWISCRWGSLSRKSSSFGLLDCPVLRTWTKSSTSGLAS